MQLDLFPEWTDGLKVADIEREALRMAKTPLTVIQLKTVEIRPTVDVNRNGIEQRLQLEVDKWLASRGGW